MNKIFVYCACGLIVPLGRWRVVRMRPEMRRSDWSSAHISGRPRQTKKISRLIPKITRKPFKEKKSEKLMKITRKVPFWFRQVFLTLAFFSENLTAQTCPAGDKNCDKPKVFISIFQPVVDWSNKIIIINK